MSQMNGKEITDGRATTHHGLGPGTAVRRSESRTAAHQLATLMQADAEDRRSPTKQAERRQQQGRERWVEEGEAVAGVLVERAAGRDAPADLVPERIVLALAVQEQLRDQRQGAEE